MTSPAIDRLDTPRLQLRRWEPGDRPVFHRLNSDDTIMRHFPQRRTRTEADALMETMLERLDKTGVGFLALVLRASGEVIGILGLGILGEHHPHAGSTEIGWRLVPEHWGYGYATEGAKACVDAAFAGPVCGPCSGANPIRDEVVAQCAVDNAASAAVMRRLGMREAEPFDHPDVDPDTHPHLIRHRLFRLTRSEWLLHKAERSA